MNKNKAFLLFILSIFPATFCFGWINEITLKTGIQKFLVFCYLEVIFILLIYMIAKGFGKAFNQTAESEIEQIQFRYKTSYLIWANYSIEATETTQLDGMKSSPNFLSTSLLTYAGAKQTPYQLFINDMHKHILASNRFGYLGDNGIWYSYDDDTSPYRTWIQDYRILQYYQMFDHSR